MFLKYLAKQREVQKKLEIVTRKFSSYEQILLRKFGPNLFILGAAKSATTSLWKFCNQLPQVYFPQDEKYKEPSYYSPHYGMSSITSYLSLYDNCGLLRYRGDSSHAYLTSPESAELISKCSDEPKFIICLRDPVERAISLHKWMVSNGYEKTQCFEEAIELEDERASSEDFKKSCGQYFYNFLYFRSGFYREQIERYFSHFDREQFLFITFDELVNTPQDKLGDIVRFLGLEITSLPSLTAENKGVMLLDAIDRNFRKNLWEKFVPHIDGLTSVVGHDLVALWENKYE